MANFQIKDLGSDSNPLGTDLFLKSAANGALTKTTFSALKDAINNEQNDALAIVANGNTHPAITSGQFVYVRNHSSLAEGLYKATAAIGTNATLSTSNLTADGSGGLNDLQAQVNSLNSKLTQRTGSLTSFGGYTTGSNLNIRQFGNIVIINGYVELLPIDANQEINIGTISGVSLPSEAIRTVCAMSSLAYNPPTSMAYCAISTSGQLKITAPSSGATAMYMNIAYCVA